MNKEEVTYLGKKISDLTREELEEALVEVVGMYKRTSESLADYLRFQDRLNKLRNKS